MPLKIDPLTLSFYHGRYAKVLVDIDFTQPSPECIFAKMIDMENNIDMSFFMSVEYENFQNFVGDVLFLPMIP